VEKVSALVASVAVARVVSNSQTTVKEDDDTITPIAFRNALITDLWKNPEPLYGIKFISGNSWYPIKFKDGSKKSIVRSSTVVFNKFHDALVFRNWLVSKVADGGRGVSSGWEIKVNDDVVGIQLVAPDTDILRSGAFQVCIAGPSAPDLSAWFIPKPIDLCGE
jgi:hypothetical protein